MTRRNKYGEAVAKYLKDDWVKRNEIEPIIGKKRSKFSKDLGLDESTIRKNFKYKKWNPTFGFMCEYYDLFGEDPSDHLHELLPILSEIHQEEMIRRAALRAKEPVIITEYVKPTKKEEVVAYRREHPQATKAQCQRDTGLSKNTVVKWWNEK